MAWVKISWALVCIRQDGESQQGVFGLKRRETRRLGLCATTPLHSSRQHCVPSVRNICSSAPSYPLMPSLLLFDVSHWNNHTRKTRFPKHTDRLTAPVGLAFPTPVSNLVGDLCLNLWQQLTSFVVYYSWQFIGEAKRTFISNNKQPTRRHFDKLNGFFIQKWTDLMFRL